MRQICVLGETFVAFVVMKAVLLTTKDKGNAKIKAQSAKI